MSSDRVNFRVPSGFPDRRSRAIHSLKINQVFISAIRILENPINKNCTLARVPIVNANAGESDTNRRCFYCATWYEAEFRSPATRSLPLVIDFSFEKKSRTTAPYFHVGPLVDTARERGYNIYSPIDMLCMMTRVEPMQNVKVRKCEC